ncbi:hypothetical protein ACFX13_004816 [Malus domestica]
MKKKQVGKACNPEVVGIRWSSVFHVEKIARVQRLSPWTLNHRGSADRHIYEAMPQRANTVEITFNPFMLSLKKITGFTARTGMKGKPEALMTLENKEDTSKINPMNSVRW